MVRLRVGPTRTHGDSASANSLVAGALQGRERFGVVLLSAGELEREAEGLAARSAITIEPTAHARPGGSAREDRGMAIMGAVPVVQDGRILGVLYGGILLSRNNALADQVVNLVFQGASLAGAPAGTATIFLNDCRVATTVCAENGARAIGTRVSQEVAEQVLDRGLPWVGRAFVVRDWYLTAYDPIRDPAGAVIGMLYVGILERPFQDLQRRFIFQYAGLLVFGLLIALALAFVMAHRISRPIHLLVRAARGIAEDTPHPPLPVSGGCREIEQLIESFNHMTAALDERNRRIREAHAELQSANETLAGLNRSYMDMLGFVSHELKAPVASIRNYVFLLEQQKVGPLTPKQMEVMKAMERSVGRMTEMIRHYLNLSRIENMDFVPNPVEVRALEEIIRPTVDSMEADASARALRMVVDVEDGLTAHADPGMLREVFDNLISNAIKYSRRETVVEILGRREGAGTVFRVRNEGEGIPADQRETIFEKFSRLERHARSDHRGTGLGLFIVRHIIQAHGGRITVDSEPGAWTEFRFNLPGGLA